MAVILFVSFWVGACSHLGSYTNSVWQNHHPAPTGLFPDSVAHLVDKTQWKAQAKYHFTKGEMLSLKGDSEEAIGEFKLALIYDKASTAIHLRLAMEYLTLSEITEALTFTEEALKLDPKFIEARLLLANIYSGLKSNDTAERHYKKILKQEPQHFQARIYLGALLVKQKKFFQARPQFKLLVKYSKKEDLSKSQMYLGKFYFEWGLSLKNSDLAAKKYRLSLKALKKSLAKDPGNTEAIFVMASDYEELGMEKKSLQVLNRFQKEFGPHKKIALYLGEYYLETKQLAKAVAQLDYLESFNTVDLNLRIARVLALVELKEYRKAIDSLDDILSEDEGLDKVRVYLATILMDVGQKRRALEHYLKLSVDSEYYLDSMIQSAKILISFKEFEEALEVLTNVSKVIPNKEVVHFLMGSVLDQLGKRDLTIEQMKKTLAINKNNIDALNYLAYIYAERGENLDEALVMAKKALLKRAQSSHILDTVGWILFKKKKYQEARGYLERAYGLSPKNTLLAEHLADVYYNLNLMKQARALYKKALFLKPDDLERDDNRENRLRLKVVATEQMIRNPAATSSFKLPELSADAGLGAGRLPSESFGKSGSVGVSEELPFDEPSLRRPLSRELLFQAK